MATDCDAPRTRDEDEPANESPDAIQARTNATTQAPALDLEDVGTAEGIDPPGTDLPHEELTVAVTPEQADEPTCAACFLVRHRPPLARRAGRTSYCSDCEG